MRKAKLKRRRPRAGVERHRKATLQRLNKAQQPEYKKRALDGFVCPLTFRTEMPTVPALPKFVSYPFPPDRFFKFDLRGSNLEREYKFGLHAEANCGVPINIIDPREFKAPPPHRRPKLHPTDAELVDDKYAMPAKTKTRLAPHEIPVEHSWIMRGEYMHNDLADDVYKHKSATEANQRLVRDRKHQADQAVMRKTKRQRIMESFEATNEEAETMHPTKPNLEPVHVWSLLPDPDRYGAEYVRVAFDSNPDDSEERKHAGLPLLSLEVQEARTAKAVVRCPQNAESSAGDGQVGSLLLPDAETAQQPDGAARMRKARDYVLSAQPAKPSEPPLYVFTWEDDSAAVHYTKVIARVDMKRELVSGAERRDACIYQRPVTTNEMKQLLTKRAVIDYDDEDDGIELISKQFPDEGEAFEGADGDDEGSVHAEAGAGTAHTQSPTGAGSPSQDTTAQHDSTEGDKDTHADDLFGGDSDEDGDEGM